MNMTCDPNAPALSAQNIRKTFGTVTAVDGLSFTVNRGEIVALLGPNGAGKTTFIDIALGLQEADSGSVQLFGGTPREAIRRSLVGVVQQTGALDTSATVDSLLRLTASLHANPAPLDEVIEQAHLADFRRTRISKLSGGEQQRVRLALALILIGGISRCLGALLLPNLITIYAIPTACIVAAFTLYALRYLGIFRRTEPH